MSLAHHPKPRMRPVMRAMFYDALTLAALDGPLRTVWLCVGCGCYVYADTAEEAYRAWASKRAQRWIEHCRVTQAAQARPTYIPGKPFEDWPFPRRHK